MTDVEKSEVSPHVEHFQIYPHDRGVEISNLSTYVMCVMWRMSPHIYMGEISQSRFPPMVTLTLTLVHCEFLYLPPHHTS